MAGDGARVDSDHVSELFQDLNGKMSMTVPSA